MAIEKCPHCNRTVLFSNNKCPSCGNDKTAEVVESFRQDQIAKQKKRIRELSSKMTLVYKLMFPIIIFGILMIMVFGFVQNNNGLYTFLFNEGILSSFAFLIFFSIAYSFLFSKFKLVKFDDDNIYYSNFNKFKKVPYNQINSVNKIKWASLTTRSEVYYLSFENSRNSNNSIYFIRKNDGTKDNPSSSINALLKKLPNATINI